MSLKRELPQRIHQLGSDQLDWPFNGTPNYKTKGPGSYARSHHVDPFPCYSHDRSLVTETAARVEEFFPIAFDVDYYLTEHEDVGRTNGFAEKNDIWDAGKNGYAGWEATIVLIGKRIPPHPAMTRYLVAHEYGHVAQWWIEKIRGIDCSKETTDLDVEYMKLREGAHNDYGGRKWHRNVGELIANDFRILVCGIEEEFWPHSGFPHPHQVQSVQIFWEKVVAEVKNGALKLAVEAGKQADQ